MSKKRKVHTSPSGINNWARRFMMAKAVDVYGDFGTLSLKPPFGEQLVDWARFSKYLKKYRSKRYR